MSEDDLSMDQGLPFCSHEFHAACIQKWLKKHNDCPLCKRLVVQLSKEKRYERCRGLIARALETGTGLPRQSLKKLLVDNSPFISWCKVYKNDTKEIGLGNLEKAMEDIITSASSIIYSEQSIQKDVCDMLIKVLKRTTIKVVATTKHGLKLVNQCPGLPNKTT